MSELESAAREVYKYAKIAVNQIICMGGESCQPCENREQLAIALDELERVLSGLTPDAADRAYRPEWGSCFWCGKPATYVIGKDDFFACEEHGLQAESNGWTIHKHKDAQPLI